MDDSSVCSCQQNGGKKIHNYFVLETMLPVEYNYLICTYTESSNHSISSRLHLNCSTKEEVFKWLEKCSSITKVTFSFEKQDNAINARCLCMKNNTRCKTGIKIQLAASNATAKSPINQSILHEYPATVMFHYTHDISEISNMFIEEIDVDKCDDTNEDDGKDVSINDNKNPKSKSTAMERFVHQKLFPMFDQDHNPKEVYSLCKTEIFDLFAKHNTNKMLRPGIKWVYEQYYNYIQYKDDIKASKEKAKLKNKSEKVKLKAINKDTTVVSSPLDSKINELCKKYVPILPASSPRKTTPEPDSTASASPRKSAKLTKSTPNKHTSSLILNLNPESTPNKLNLVPLKLIPNDVTVQNKLPELKIAPNPNVTPLLKVLPADDSRTGSISVPSYVGGILILANRNKQTSKDTSSSNVSSNQKPTSSASASRKRKQPRKSCLKYEDPGEIFFTNRVEDLLSNVKKTRKKTTRQSARIASKKKDVKSKSRIAGKTKKAVQDNARIATKKKKAVQSNARNASKKKKTVQGNARIARKNKKIQKIVKCTAIDSIENVICSD